MSFFDHWYRASQEGMHELSRDEAARFLFLYHYSEMDDYLKDNWREFAKDYIINTPLGKFGPEEHLTLFIEWSHSRGLLI